MAEMTLWQRNTTLNFIGIPEEFKIIDFCNFIRKGVCKFVSIGFAQSVTEEYKNDFKAAVEEMKKNWSSEMPFPDLTMR